MTRDRESLVRGDAVTNQQDTKRPMLSRRDLLRVSTSVGMGIAGAFGLTRNLAFGSTSPAKEPAKAGDILVVAFGQDKNTFITVDDVPPGGSPVTLAWPWDGKTETVRSDRARNLVLLIRARQDSWYSAAERPHTVSGVAAYSATCTHLCCPTSNWTMVGVPRGALLCTCHRSRFDPWDGARVIDGPAPRPLPILPLTVDQHNRLVVKAGFLTAPGCPP
jgi:rieske iron-sulfur protein